MDAGAEMFISEILRQVCLDSLFDFRPTDGTFSQRLRTLDAGAEMPTRDKNDISHRI